MIKIALIHKHHNELSYLDDFNLHKKDFDLHKEA